MPYSLSRVVGIASRHSPTSLSGVIRRRTAKPGGRAKGGKTHGASSLHVRCRKESDVRRASRYAFGIENGAAVGWMEPGWSGPGVDNGRPGCSGRRETASRCRRGEPNVSETQAAMCGFLRLFAAERGYLRLFAAIAMEHPRVAHAPPRFGGEQGPPAMPRACPAWLVFVMVFVTLRSPPWRG